MADQRRRGICRRPETKSRDAADRAGIKDTRKCLVLLGAILEAPELVDRLSEVLKPAGSQPLTSRRRKEARGGSKSMNWEMFYLTCFLVGVTLSLLAFVGGSLHLPHVHFHLSHGHRRSRYRRRPRRSKSRP